MFRLCTKCVIKCGTIFKARELIIHVLNFWWSSKSSLANGKAIREGKREERSSAYCDICKHDIPSEKAALQPDERLLAYVYSLQCVTCICLLHYQATSFNLVILVERWNNLWPLRLVWEISAISWFNWWILYGNDIVGISTQ